MIFDVVVGLVVAYLSYKVSVLENEIRFLKEDLGV